MNLKIFTDVLDQLKQLKLLVGVVDKLIKRIEILESDKWDRDSVARMKRVMRDQGDKK